jgi:L-ascorbate metabolism protein UlaG (beta-lactamase superfamily)
MILVRYEQSGFTLESDGKVIAVDIGKYTTPESLARIGRVEAALVSHLHADHCFAPHLEAMTTEVYTVAEAAETLSDTQLNIHIHKVGDVFDIPGTPFAVKVYPSDHGPHATLQENTAFLISDLKTTLYFLGDMFVPAEPIKERFDALLIPVGNGKYTFGPQEAANYLEALKWGGFTVPVHCNEAAGNMELEWDFIRLSRANNRVMKVGDAVMIGS